MKVYGEVEHRHGTCRIEAHVDLALSDQVGQSIRSESVPIRAKRPVRAGRLYSWTAPSFDAQLTPIPPAGSLLAIAFHDVGCSDGTSFDCGENRALPEPSGLPAGVEGVSR